MNSIMVRVVALGPLCVSLCAAYYLFGAQYFQHPQLGPKWLAGLILGSMVWAAFSMIAFEEIPEAISYLQNLAKSPSGSSVSKPAPSKVASATNIQGGNGSPMNQPNKTSPSPTLSAQEKARIEEEERYRAQVRARYLGGSNPTPSSNPYVRSASYTTRLRENVDNGMWWASKIVAIFFVLAVIFAIIAIFGH